MQGSHRSGGAHQLQPAPMPAPMPALTPPAGPRHARRHAPRPEPPAPVTAQARRRAAARAAARERMMARRRRSLGVLSLLVLAVTVVITITRPTPQEAVAAARDAPHDVPVGVYSANTSSVPPGADADRVSAALLSVPAETGASAGAGAGAAVPVTWTRPAGATIRCPVTATACVDLKAKITWLQHGSRIFLGPVRMQPGEGSKKTPRGTYTITKKAAVYYSHTYGGAMPYSVFWGHDGIAYHEGTLTGFSHGCIHLSMANAQRFFAALHLGERVYVA